MIGGNFKGDALAVSQALKKNLWTGIAYNSINGNTRLNRETEKQYKLIRYHDSTRKLAGNELLFLPSSFLLVLDEFFNHQVIKLKKDLNY